MSSISNIDASLVFKETKRSKSIGENSVNTSADSLKHDICLKYIFALE